MNSLRGFLHSSIPPFFNGMWERTGGQDGCKDGLIKEKVYGHVTEKALLDFVEPYLKKKD